MIAAIDSAIEGNIAVDPASHLPFVSDFYDDCVTLVDTTTNRTTQRVPVSPAPGDVALDPGAHALDVVFRSRQSVWLLDSATFQKMA